MLEHESKATRKEVAELAGVSEPVVSWVMSGRAAENRISPETIQRTRTAAQRLGYRPNIFGRLLKTQRSGLLAFISSDLSDPNTTEIVKAVNLTARRRNFGLMIFDLAGEPAISEENLRLFKNCFAEGFIVHSPFQGHGGRGRTFAGKPYCVLGNTAGGRAPAIEVDNAFGGELAVRHLLHSGARNIGVIADCADFNFVRQRLSGCARALGKHQRLLTFFRAPEVDPFEAGGAAVDAWHRDKKMPDGVFALGDTLAIGALARLRQLGIACPAEVKLIGFDGAPMARYAYPPLTTIVQPFAEMAERAIEALLQLLRGERVPQREILLKPIIAVRASTRGNVARASPPATERKRTR